MSGATTGTGTLVPYGRPGTGAGARALASVRGLAFCGLAVFEGLLITLLTNEVSLALLAFPLLLIPPTLRGVRRQANLVRRLCGRWCGVPIEIPYRPATAGELDAEARAGVWARFARACGRMLSDLATWRDMLWCVADSLVGWLIAGFPALLLGYGLFGVVMPAVWSPIVHAGGNQWYAFIPVTGWLTAALCVPLGCAFIALGLWLAPRAMRWYGLFARSMLAPARQAELTQQVKHLAETRADAVDAGAAEMRRIERDLHDGAQARLVAMGMTLSAAEQVLDENPAAARALLLEARDASARALTELRDLVRGIHPPVLADRGIADAIRALALDSPLQVQVHSRLPGRPPAPVESAAYFAVSELLANVSKHAGARQVWIDLRYERGALRIDVGDDGRGGADPARGTGLRGIERRLAAFDGILALSSPPGGPTVATMELPCALSSPKTSSS
jgi:signal transduction histidine kinase